MTVNYENYFLRALFHWNGSVWKAIWLQLLVWVAVFSVFRSLMEHVVFKNDFETYQPIVNRFRDYIMKVPVELLLGFYVNQIVKRWWEQVSLIPWPDEIMAHVCSVLYKNDEATVHRRRTVGRYVLVSMLLAYRNVSTRVKEMYPNLHALRRCGLLTEEEQELLNNSDQPDLQHEIALQWIHEAVRSNVDSTQGPLVFALNAFRNQLRNLTHFDAISLPLVYTQTVTVAVYGLFLFAFIGNTSLPFLTVMRFVWGVGWLKVGQDLQKPFGKDDDDIDLPKWIRRHVQFVYALTESNGGGDSAEKFPTNSWSNDKTSMLNIESELFANAKLERNEKSKF